jgi:hypothetical protein
MRQWWARARRILWWPVAIIGALTSLWSRYLDYKDTVALGLPSAAWLGIGLTIFFVAILAMLFQFQRRTESTPGTAKIPHKLSKNTQPSYDPKLLAQAKEKLDAFIERGDELSRMMESRGFNWAQLELWVQRWLDGISREIWDILPQHAAFIMSEQGDFTHDEKIRYEGWPMKEAALRITVDRKLARLREIRSRI